MFIAKRQGHGKGSAILIVLGAVVLITVLVVTLLTIARFERVSSSVNLAHNQAEVLSDLAADIAIERIGEATEAGRQPRSAWSSEPGRIHLFSMSAGNGQITRSTVNLFSGPPGADDPITKDLKSIDLNEPTLAGLYPIAPPAAGKSVANMKIGWINLLADPGVAASKTNQIVGRIAFWVDDESCKVNINTADGSQKNDPLQSYGFGTPSEISLAALPGASLTIASSIALYATASGFNSAAEVGRATGLGASFFADNKFNITYYSRSPDLNIFGEPKIQLFPVNRTTGGEVRNMMLGFYGAYGAEAALANDTTIRAISSTISHVYPTSAQLPQTTVNGSPARLPQYLSEFKKPTVSQAMTTASFNYPLGMRMASYLNGRNSLGQSIIWPRFSGATASGFTGKYTARQIDSICLQIQDVVAGCWMADQGRTYSLPTIMAQGFLSSQIVSGIGRAPLFNEVFVEVQNSTASVSGKTIVNSQFRINAELVFPRFYEGTPLQAPYGVDPANWPVGDTSAPHTLNSQDRPLVTSNLTTGNSLLGGRWMDNMLRIYDGSATQADMDSNAGSAQAGIDLMGNPGEILDPDQVKAAAYHPFRLNSSGVGYNGSILGQSTVRPALQMTTMAAVGQSWYPGGYHAIMNANRPFAYPSKPNLTSMTVAGGLSLWTHNETGGTWRQFDFSPLEGLRGPTYTGESTASIRSTVLASVLPVSMSVPALGVTSYLLRVKDPLVNKNAGDWEAVTNPSGTQLTMEMPSSKTVSYAKGGATSVDANFPLASGIVAPDNFDGDNPGYKPTGGGDPLSLWLPRQDIRMPKLSRFPSVGALNSVRTGILPDSGASGTPWRSISLTPASGSGQTTAAGSYPDWAMLDLFTVPFLPQKPVTMGSDTQTDARILTSGGSTEGRLNINNPRIPYPFSESVPGVTQTPPERTAPLEALFFGLKASTQYDVNGDPIYAVVDEKALAAAVQTYLSTNSVMMIPGEVANVPEIDSYTYAGVTANARSRNDVVRQLVGALTTQSNVFSVWVVAQTVKKVPTNSDYGQFQAGDTVTGSIRRRYTIERYIETGKDGVPGNAVNPGLDGIVNTEDDPIDAAYHPAMTYPLPYRWRIVQVEDVPL